MSGTVKPPTGFTTVPPQAASKSDKDRRCLGVELPFGWCLVKGDKLRKLQAELHEAQQTAAMRLRMCGQLHKEILRKESR